MNKKLIYLLLVCAQACYGCSTSQVTDANQLQIQDITTSKNQPADQQATDIYTTTTSEHNIDTSTNIDIELTDITTSGQLNDVTTTPTTMAPNNNLARDELSKKGGPCTGQKTKCFALYLLSTIGALRN